MELRGQNKLTALVCTLLFVFALRAETLPEDIYLEHDTYIDLDDNISLFKFYNANYQSHNNIFESFDTSISTKRRGVEWWQLSRINNSSIEVNSNIEQPSKSLSTKVFASNNSYRIGAMISYNTLLSHNWGVESSIFARTGRDGQIEGVFRNEVTPSIKFTRNFGNSHHLSLSAKLPYQMRALRSGATQECFELTHNNLYNPSWGYYNGEVRSSRVVRNLQPSLNVDYIHPITTSNTTAAIHLTAEYGTRKLSRIGWYDASNPSPNYYNKLPSYYLSSSAYESVVESWQQNNTQYTQFAWDKLESINLSSSDGSAYYTVEDQVERVADIDLSLLFTTQIGNNIKISYGGRVSLSNRRYYKEMRDLLGGEYLLDIDQYADDFTSSGNQLQNNLREPNRKISVGDRFGYDYTYHRTLMESTAQFDYHASRILTSLSVTIREELIHRQGHYEKERFQGSASYGNSQTISLDSYSFHALGGYTLSSQHSTTLHFDFDSKAPLSRYMFINGQNSNCITSSPTTEKIASAEIEHRYTSTRMTVTTKGYMILCYDGQQVWQGYDDISTTYCDIVISDIATRSFGVEISGEFRVMQRWQLTTAIAAGGAAYASSPLVQLYDDNDLSLVAESRASTLKGYIVGNTPQVSAKVESKYFGRNGFILGVELSYFALRYASPSIIRRTNRILNALTSTEALSETLSQQQLPNLLDGSISLTKSFKLKDNTKITAYISAKNLIGGNNVIYSAREANRVLSSYSSSLLYGYTPQESTYQYTQGRNYYISVGYAF